MSLNSRQNRLGREKGGLRQQHPREQNTHNTVALSVPQLKFYNNYRGNLYILVVIKRKALFLNQGRSQEQHSSSFICNPAKASIKNVWILEHSFLFGSLNFTFSPSTCPTVKHYKANGMGNIILGSGCLTRNGRKVNSTMYLPKSSSTCPVLTLYFSFLDSWSRFMEPSATALSAKENEINCYNYLSLLSLLDPIKHFCDSSKWAVAGIRM